MERYFRLSFVGNRNPELFETSFAHPAIIEVKTVIRGKSGGAFSHCGSFQWTRAVKALCNLVLRAVYHHRKGDSPVLPILVGDTQSLAASLDYAIDKHPIWLIDMFGLDGAGNPTVRRMLRRTNPGRKRPGPTAIGLNMNFLPIEGIEISWKGRTLKSADEILELLDAIAWEDASESVEMLQRKEASA